VNTAAVPRAGGKDICYIVINDLATVVWCANLANLAVPWEMLRRARSRKDLFRQAAPNGIAGSVEYVLSVRLKILFRNFALSLTIVAVTTFLCFRVIPVNATTAGFAYLLDVLGIATAWGLIEAILASIVAMLCFNFFFLPPIGQFTISDPQNWVALFAFLATALIASQVSDRERRQAREAKSSQRETEQLYALSRFILLTEHSQSVGKQAAQHIAEVFECRAVALYDAKSAEIFRGGVEDLPGVEGKLRETTVTGGNFSEAAAGLVIAPILLGGRPVGALALKDLSLSDGALQALLNLVAIALERVRTEEAANRAEAARQSEEFKSTLLDAVAHEFKTPLTSIKAGSTALLSDASLSPQTRELATIIDEEADRLKILVSEAARMAQIDAGKVRLERATVDVGDLMRRVMGRFESRAEGRELKLTMGDGSPRVCADRELLALAIRQLVDNALKYSPPGSPVTVSAGSEDHQVVIRVRDRGAGIAERDRERIFEKFYRRADAKNGVPGTGLGLFIAREIVRAHGGEIRVESAPGNGSEFCVSLPAEDGG
jgi:two-component system, OmpR family, sensor histidine kinase KdpD